MLAFGLADNYTGAAFARLIGGFFNCSFTCGFSPLLSQACALWAPVMLPTPATVPTQCVMFKKPGPKP